MKILSGDCRGGEEKSISGQREDKARTWGCTLLLDNVSTNADSYHLILKILRYV